MPRWDVKFALAQIFMQRHPDFVPLGQFITEQPSTLKAHEKPDHEWPVYGVSNREGVFLSHYQKGEDFKANYLYRPIRKDWFFHNPTRANVGSMGKVPAVPDDAITSPEYEVWSVSDPDWLPDYVEILTKLPYFQLFVNVNRVGAVKERLYVRNLAAIPVPPWGKDFQEQAIERWRAARSKIEASERRIEEHENELVADVLAQTGITIDKPPKRCRGFGLESHRLHRWGASFNRERWSLDSLLATERHPRTRLADVADVNPGRTKLVAADDIVSFVPMEAVCSITGTIVDSEEREFSEVARGYTPFENGDVIWAKITPCMENGKSAVARNLKNGIGFGSTEFHVIRSKKPDEVLPEYLWCLLRLRELRIAAKRYFTGSAGQQRVPEEFLAELVIPVPVKDAQEAIIEGVAARRAAVESERALAAAEKELILSQIEMAIIAGSFDSATEL